MAAISKINRITLSMFFIILSLSISHHVIAMDYGNANKVYNNKIRWNNDEDQKLLQAIRNAKLNDDDNILPWPKIAAQVPKRTSKQCRERWYNHLDPGIIRGPFSQEEIEKIYDMQEKIGNKWSRIADKLPGRTPNQVKNYWHSKERMEKKKKRDQRQCCWDIRKQANEYRVKKKIKLHHDNTENSIAKNNTENSMVTELKFDVLVAVARDDLDVLNKNI
jgi:hypothetical protein